MAEIRVEIDKFDEKVGGKMRAAATRAALRATNASLRAVRTFAIRFASDKTGLKQKDLKSRFRFFNATRSNPVASLNIGGSGIPLFQFGAKRFIVQTNRGKRVGVTALIHGQRVLIPGAFIAVMKSGKKGIFERKTEKRLPIRQLFSDELTQAMGEGSGFLSQAERLARTKLKENFERDFKYFYESSR